MPSNSILRLLPDSISLVAWQRLSTLACLSAACCLPAQGSEPACPIPGEPVQWIADYCMAGIGTDDEIAASDCIHQQLQLEFDSACKAKTHFKRALCQLLLEQGTVRGPIERCLNDPAVQGRTVRHGGAGS